jgi:hypothetical protein
MRAYDIHGMRPGDAGAIHVLSLEGDLVSSFAEVYPTSNPIIRHHLSQGHIACLEGAGLVLHAPQNLPQVRAYDATGVLRWWLEMEGFEPLPGPFDGGSRGPLCGRQLVADRGYRNRRRPARRWRKRVSGANTYRRPGRGRPGSREIMAPSPVWDRPSGYPGPVAGMA